MKRLKIILSYNYFYIIIFLLSILVSILKIYVFPIKSGLSNDTTSFEGKIINIFIDGAYLSMVIENNERVNVNYYFKTEIEKNNFILSYELGDVIRVDGEFSKIVNSNSYAAFDYVSYSLKDKTFYNVNASSYTKVSDNKSIFYTLKNKVIKLVDENSLVKNYLYAFILGNTKYLGDYKVIYQNLGISHLFAISGMHISLISMVILKVLKKLNKRENINYIITCALIGVYAFITGFSPSILRAGICFILLAINKILKLNISSINILLLTGCIILLNNCYLLFNSGFIFSFTICMFLMIYGSNDKSYFKKLWKTSLLAFIVSFPLSSYFFCQINILSVIYNMFFVPYVTFIVFPLAIISSIIPFFSKSLLVFISLMECVGSFLNQIPSLIILRKLNIIYYLGYYVFIILFLSRKGKYYFLAFLCLFLIHYNYNVIFSSKCFMFLDVSQGDSALMLDGDFSILIDTGGKVITKKEKWQERKYQSSLSSYTVIPTLKALGIRKINFLIITHGDFDHMGEAINIVNGYKVNSVIFNGGAYNDLESNLIKLLDSKNIKYYQNIKKLNANGNWLYFLNNVIYDNENDNSNVIYTKFNNYKFLLMGDASIKVEEDILKRYNLYDIDVLKVGHHGSKTSSSKYFIDKINPKYSVISVGKNNRYNHPNKSVLDNLKNSKIYRTDIDGSIMFNIKNNKLKITTYSS